MQCVNVSLPVNIIRNTSIAHPFLAFLLCTTNIYSSHCPPPALFSNPFLFGSLVKTIFVHALQVCTYSCVQQVYMCICIQLLSFEVFHIPNEKYSTTRDHVSTHSIMPPTPKIFDIPSIFSDVQHFQSGLMHYSMAIFFWQCQL